MAHLLISSSFRSNVFAIRLACARRGFAVTAIVSDIGFGSAIECGQLIDLSVVIREFLIGSVTIVLSPCACLLRENSVWPRRR